MPRSVVGTEARAAAGSSPEAGAGSPSGRAEGGIPRLSQARRAPPDWRRSYARWVSSPGGEAEPPGARPLVRTALLLVVALVVGAVVWLAVDLTLRGPSAPTPAPTPTPVACAPPPPPPTSVPHFSQAPDPALAAGATWRATLVTTCGTVTLDLDGRSAPRTVASFVQLARGGYWTDSVCHRLTSRQAPTAFLQCGDPTGRSLGDPGYALALENVPADRHYVRGTVAMARQPGTTGTAGEFVLVYEDFTVPAGAPVYPVFGRVAAGMEVIDAIAADGGEDTRPDGPPFTSISIRTVEVRPR